MKSLNESLKESTKIADASKELEELGATETTTARQKRNGTSEWTLPTGEIITEHTSGYVRKKNFDRLGYQTACHQITPVRKMQHPETGEFFSDRVMLKNRSERLGKIISYAKRKIAQSKF